MRLIALIALCGVVVAGQTRVARAQTFDFVVDPVRSALEATANFDVASSGTLIGNFEATTNPQGTRTKPGLLGSFGATENLPVALTTSLNLGGPIGGATSGAFRLALDVAAGAVYVAGFRADLLASGTTTLPATVGLNAQSFRTRNPSSFYLAIPFTLPLGQVTVSALRITQQGDNSVGVLAPTGTNTYAFVVTFPAVLDSTLDVFGQPVNNAAPILWALSGSVVVSQDTAVITSATAVNVSESFDPNQTLPPLPLSLPTLPPQTQTADVLLDLTVNQVRVGVNGTYTLVANGRAATRAAFKARRIRATPTGR